MDVDKGSVKQSYLEICFVRIFWSDYHFTFCYFFIFIILVCLLLSVQLAYWCNFCKNIKCKISLIEREDLT